MNWHRFLLPAALLLGSAQAQLLQTPAQTASQATLQGFKATSGGTVLTRGQATVKLDVAGGRVVGVYVTAP
ncbi:hypothetical protein ACFP81_02215 [Deinococcus lacus]|uniref:Uncharacterized protein n=1 Tax=Deinococcus lacus TaxID=392561 RepID=A0ABW1YC30_9DEIO